MSTPDAFTPIPLFSTPLFSSVVAGHEEHREPLIRLILDLQRRYPGIVRSNRGAWHSGPEWLEHPSEHVAWMLQKVIKFAKLALAKYYDNWSSQELELASSWANVLGAGGWNAPHHHFPCTWSGVYYVSVPPIVVGSGDPAGMIEFMNPTPWLSGLGQGGNFVYAPKPGLPLLFPSNVYHYVHPHQTPEPRVSIAYNLVVTPKAGSRDAPR